MDTSVGENGSTEKVPVGYRFFGALISDTRTRDLVARTQQEIIAEMHGHQKEEPELYIMPIWTEEEYQRDLKDARTKNQQRDRTNGRGLDRKDGDVEAKNVFNSMMNRLSGSKEV